MEFLTVNTSVYESYAQVPKKDILALKAKGTWVDIHVIGTEN